ncbi:MAG TPA: hydrogen gas-evolving membrane-bound hydrogenase subunit E [Ilumatobacteraceae bacterium]|nr:hydrogen gas-evolving membrane-bound hydrogenase subunit E [Ilumatobacteraceae bacterium]
MIWLVLALYVAAVLVIAVAGTALGRRSLWVAAVPMAVAAIWSATLLASGEVVTAGFAWVPGLDIEILLRVDALRAALSVLVAGIGALVCVYAVGYFSTQAAGLGRFSATLVAFSGAMVGLVWSDSVWTLFVFWELTSITSFLLVGFKNTDALARTAARRALVITASGGLALLAGFVLLVDAAGTAVISEIGPVSGSTATAAAILVLVAAATKSAQFPFHVWLPGAMAAPTPVSAYLHSATMVKAGVIVVALLAPALQATDIWKPLGLTFGLVTMIWGSVGALRHVDAKLILAWGTVSQLGLLVTLLAIGTPKAMFAAVSMLVAHAVFKAALFMVIGEVDVRTGTRNINELSGLRRSMPVTFGVALVAGLSMAGIPPLLGFPAKEAAVEAVLGLAGTERLLVGGLVIGGAALTVAYTTRLLVGMFGSSAPMADHDVAPQRPAMMLPAVVLAGASFAGFVALGWVADVVRTATVILEPGAEVYTLYRWPGLTDAFVTSMIVVAVGIPLGLLLAQRAVTTGPAARGAAVADSIIDSIGRAARGIAGVVQHGSLPLYLATTVVTVGAASVVFVGEIDLDALYWWDNRAEAVLVVLVVAAAVAATTVTSRLGAALVLGSVGFGIAGLFVALGAPDLVLTQLLVETVIVVGFVLGLGRLGTRFPRATRLWLTGRIAISVIIGGAVAVALAAGASSPTGEPPILELAVASVDEGGGNNVVNVILTDIRALDTLGEVIVLMAVAAGILALTRRRAVDGRPAPTRTPPSVPPTSASVETTP